LSNTTVSRQMFVDYKLETTCFGTFGHHQVSSKITEHRSIYGALAGCVDGEISASKLCCVIWKQIYWSARG